MLNTVKFPIKARCRINARSLFNAGVFVICTNKRWVFNNCQVSNKCWVPIKCQVSKTSGTSHNDVKVNVIILAMSKKTQIIGLSSLTDRHQNFAICQKNVKINAKGVY